MPQLPECRHNSNKLKCELLTMRDILKFHNEFYCRPNKKDQDAFLLKHCMVKKTKRRRPRVGERKATELHTKLYVRKENSVRLIPVCQKAFLGILQITVHRVRRVAKVFAATGSVVQEKRGGDRRSAKNAHKLEAVKTFIKSFHCIESHYCRSSTERKYLPSTLNIKKMWRMYEEQSDAEHKVRHCYFRRIFNRCFNLGFGNPRTDTCSRCTELIEKMKTAQSSAEKNKWMTEKRVHVLKAKYFYRLLKERKENIITISFDCQKNQVLPKVSDGMAYYSRQLYIYNFGTVLSTPENRLNRDNVTLYVWTEDEHRKGANEIASGVYHRLNNLSINETVDTIRLIADGCGAQNKNSIMIGMCATWLLKNAPRHIKMLEIVFPVPGHSFLPPDRVFGNIEKDLKKMEEIVSPEEYINVFNKYGTVVRLDNVMDWKSALQNVIRPPGGWHFQFAQCKRFHLKRTNNNILVRGEVNYASDIGVYKSILKKRKSLIDMNPRQIEKKKVTIKREKITDVKKLLAKHYGDEWQNRDELRYYKEVIEKSETGQEDEEYEEEECQPTPSDSDLRV